MFNFQVFAFLPNLDVHLFQPLAIPKKIVLNMIQQAYLFGCNRYLIFVVLSIKSTI